MAKINASLVEALKNGVVSFTYVKANGEVRKAVGTLNPEAIAKAGIKASVRDLTVAETTNRYIDLEKGSWRRYGSEVTL